jgi:2-hydroxyglutarate dehydrogenase
VGGGIVGLAVARELTARDAQRSVWVFERDERLARHQTTHNSGVIHAGIYYAPGSLKARLCVVGARELYEFCERNAIASERRGKVIVASDRRELAGLEELERRGQANGVQGLRRLDEDGLRELEPHARGVAALHSPNTGVVDFGEVADALARELLEAGAGILTGCEVHAATPRAGGILLTHARGETLARHAVFCAGAWADSLAGGAGRARGEVRIVPFRGAYLRLAPGRAELVRSLIYPVPDPSLPFLGVHFTRTITGEVLIGPTAIPALARQPSAPLPTLAGELWELLAWPGSWRMAARWWRTGATELLHAAVRSTLVRAARRYVPELTANDVQPAFAGVRAQAVARDGRLVDDFVFSYGERAVHVRSAPSPAATACLAIARHIADEAERQIAL